MPGLSTIYSVCIADVEISKTMVLLPTRHLGMTTATKQILASLVGMKSEPKERVHLQCGILRKTMPKAPFKLLAKRGGRWVDIVACPTMDSAVLKNNIGSQVPYE
ncbi:hypothetical protein HCBG_02324 [Histoplasma capsulatum G186AR]|uniref:Uncharacterized protein n=2 Tax=Ajellomyces capsulatus TaxID=5037 RepID=C0NIR7_AJECG|nr:uncharacterized protein HCBG_02324 [Histoplasma capsulatum G186AR]EEH08787.1 hypothetical protein HCBG_02324 [Histoplasma capsulatum G186AR]KAG5303905.1 hypothetical protein I7I52_02048 [Histoplasma capsulatum]QSS69503.1 hypothetical protein I7I50_10809 [Histoplasma capsulatum G186AR]